MRSIIQAALFVLFILGMNLYFSVKSANKSEENIRLNTRYFQRFNYSFAGTVVEKYALKSGHNAGIFLLKLSRTDISHFDERDSLKYFFCVIKDSEAVIAPAGLGVDEVEVGDVISVSGAREELVLYRGTKQVERKGLSVQTSNDFGCLDDINDRTRKWLK